jgi:hypothetical protein
MASGRAQDSTSKWWHERAAMQSYHESDPFLFPSPKGRGVRGEVAGKNRDAHEKMKIEKMKI